MKLPLTARRATSEPAGARDLGKKRSAAAMWTLHGGTRGQITGAYDRAARPNQSSSSTFQ